MRIMSVNLRYDNPEDGEYIWENRFPAMKLIWNQVDADVIGIQEGLPHQVNNLNKAFSIYNYVGKGRDKHGKGEHVGIFFNKNKFSLLDEGHFWLSETPDIPGSQSYGSAAPRMSTWVLLKYKQKELLFLNTHLDHKSEKAKIKGIKIICDFLNNHLESDGIIITGDLNTPPNSELIHNLLECGCLKDIFQTKNKSEPTYHAFSEEALIAVDYILTSRSFKLESCEVITKKPYGIYPSDHYPICCDIKI
ncbi:MAG: endonuclease/exonuclease/phosphatase family protein [Halanaerobiales bacterium]